MNCRKSEVIILTIWSFSSILVLITFFILIIPSYKNNNEYLKMGYKNSSIYFLDVKIDSNLKYWYLHFFIAVLSLLVFVCIIMVIKMYKIIYKDEYLIDEHGKLFTYCTSLSIPLFPFSFLIIIYVSFIQIDFFIGFILYFCVFIIFVNLKTLANKKFKFNKLKYINDVFFGEKFDLNSDLNNDDIFNDVDNLELYDNTEDYKNKK